MDRRLIRTSKFLSRVLRHRPESIGLRLDESGWADVCELIRFANASGHRLSEDILEKVVAKNDKKRFSFSSNGACIRANQGHSIEVDLGLEPVDPPQLLYHGTASRNLVSIRKKGLLKGRRHHVHLSPDVPTAIKVGNRHGPPVVLKIHAGRMYRDGEKFYRSDNGVWLADHVPAEYLEIIDQK